MSTHAPPAPTNETAGDRLSDQSIPQAEHGDHHETLIGAPADRVSAAQPLPAPTLETAGDRKRVRALRLASRAAAALLILGGLLVLLGWQLDLQSLRAIGPVDVVMNPLAALLFVLTGSVLLLDGQDRSQRLARAWGAACGLVITLCGGLVLLRTLASWPVGVDELLFREQVLSATPADRMAENTALSFLLLGLALLSRRVRTRRGGRPAHWLLLPVALVSLLVVIGYLYHTAGFITFQLQLPMALNTAVFFLAACLALVAARPKEGAMALFVSESAGGALTRRLLPALLLVPLVLGALIDLGMRSGWYGPTVGLALLTLATIVLSVLLTITTAGALHRSDLALRRSEEHFRTLIESGSDYIVIFDREGAITYVGPSVEKLLGYRPEEVLGKGPEALVHPDDLTQVYQMIGTIFAAPGEVVRLEYRIRHREGSWRVFESFGRTLRVDSADSGAVANARDITAHKEAERLAEIAERERREKTALLESTSEGIFGVDLRGRCTFLNGAASRMLGYAPQECMGQNMHRLIHHSQPDGTPYPEEECSIFQAFREGRSVRADNEVLWRKDGTAFPALYSSSPIHENGALQGAVVTFSDITAQKEAEQALRRAKEEAEKANRAKSEFLSRMSHELRTPMNSILGFGQLLTKHDLSEEQRRSTDHILRAGKHLLRLIDEVLDIARIEANRQQLSIEPVSVQSVVQEVVSLIRPLAAQHGCEITDMPAGGCDRYVRADRQRLTQVLLNLLSNAIKYNRPGGSVTVLCDTARDAEGARDDLRIHVCDTGPGIPADRLSELFVPFSRLGAEQTEIEGTGLGLALSQRLVEAMGGRLTVESTVGEGCTFTVELPRTESPVERWVGTGATTARSPAAERKVRSATILYIEDNLANFSLIQSILTARPGIHLISALQGRLGLDLAWEHAPDLILLDLHLPDLAGDEVLRRLRGDPRTREIPVIIISADATPSRIQRLRQAGAHDYITKPLDVDGFLEAVDRVLVEEGE